MEGSDGLRARFLHDIGHGDDPRVLPVDRDVHGCLALSREPIGRPESGVEVDAFGLEELGVARQHGLSPNVRLDAVARDRLEAGDQKDRELPLLGRADDGLAQGVLRGLLGGGRQGKELPPRRRARLGTMSVASGLPFVMVPVLSKTIVSTLCAVSSAAPDLMRTPCSAPRPVPTMMAVGVARPRAQGQAIVSTATKTVRAKAAPCPRRSQMPAETKAMPKTTGTK